MIGIPDLSRKFSDRLILKPQIMQKIVQFITDGDLESFRKLIEISCGLKVKKVLLPCTELDSNVLGDLDAWFARTSEPFP